MNRLTNVKIFQAAVAERTSFVGISTDQGSCQNQICDAANTALMVPCIDLDSLSLPQPDLIKIDVEGAESVVIGGAQKLLFEKHPVVFVALHSDEQRTNCAALLRQAGYAVYDLGGAALNGAIAVDEIYARADGLLI